MSRNLGAACAALALVGCGNKYTVQANTNTDFFEQVPNNEVDVLWVIDNSNSMAEEQQELANGFQSFANQLEDSLTDFHIGVITTSFDYDDDQRGVLIGDPPYLTNADDYVTAFQQRAIVGIDGADKEKGLEAAQFALQPTMVNGGPNDGFLRDEAQLLIVFVSDEEDCSDAGALEGEPASACYTSEDALTPVEDFIQFFRGIKQQSDWVKSSAIIGAHPSTCAAAEPGDRYFQVVRGTGGSLGDICEPDWSDMLGQVGDDAQAIITSFQLTEAAQPDTIEVTSDADDSTIAEDETNGWTYDPATWYMTFHGDAIPQRGSGATVKYTVDAQANQAGRPEGSTSGSGPSTTPQ